MPRGDSVDSLGRYLRKSREAKGITLEEVARISKISLSYLRALEEEQFHILPAPIFTIGFLKQYACCVGLDPEDVVLRYRLATRATPEDGERRRAKRAGPGRRRSFWTFAACLFLVLLWGFLYPGVKRPRERVRTIRVPPATGRETRKEQLRRELGITEEPLKGMTAQGSGEFRRAALLGTGAGEPGRGRTTVQPVEVLIQAIQRTWIRVDLDGKSPHEMILEPGERYTCRADKRVRLHIGNGAGVRIFYKGKVFENLGKQGDVVHISFPLPNATRAGVHPGRPSKR